MEFIPLKRINDFVAMNLLRCLERTVIAKMEFISLYGKNGNCENGIHSVARLKEIVAMEFITLHGLGI